MKHTFNLLVTLITIVATAQTTFQKGYFVTKNDQQTECLIKNYDWNRIPTEIEYKTDESAEVKKIYTSQLQSFYIVGTSHMYKEYDVPAIPEQKGNIVIKPGRQLLKVIAEGKASLLESDNGIYYLHLEGQPAKPLIYDRFINTSTQREVTDNSYRLELYNSLKCGSINPDYLRKVKYTAKQLTKVITEYNQCQESETVRYTDAKTITDFNIHILAGVNLYNSKADILLESVNDLNEPHLADSYTLETGSKINITAGFEAEVRLPFHHNKWALFVAPLYQKQEGFIQHVSRTFPMGYLFGTDYGGTVTLTDYSYVEVPIGLRHYFIINENSELNLNFSYGIFFDLSSKPEVTYTKDANSRDMYYSVDSGLSSYRLGIGYLYKNYSVGLNYYLRKELGDSNTNGSISVLLGYKIL